MADTGSELKSGELGFWSAVAVGFGLITSSTTLFITGNTVGQIGSGLLISMLIAFIFMILTALALSELSTMYPVAGSFTTYAKHAFGSTAGIVVGLVYWLVFLALASEASIVGNILNYVFPGVLPARVWGTLLVVLFVGINIIGIDWVGKMAAILLGTLAGGVVLLSLLQIGGFGVTQFDPSALTWVQSGWSPILGFVPLAVWLFVGWEVLGPLAEEVKDAKNTLPKAMITIIVLVLLFRAPFIIAMDGTLSSEALTQSPFPQVVAFEAFFGVTGRWIMAIISFLATGATFNAVLAGTSRQLWNLGQEGYLPESIGHLNSRFKTPDVALLITGAIILVLVWAVSVPTVLINASTNMFIIVYLTVLASVIALRYKNPDQERPFYAGGPKTVPIVSVVGIIGLAIAFFYSGDTVRWVSLAIVAVITVFALLITRMSSTKERGESRE